MSVIAILLLIMGVFENILPAFFVYIALGIILADVVIIIVLGNTICRRLTKKNEEDSLLVRKQRLLSCKQD